MYACMSIYISTYSHIRMRISTRMFKYARNMIQSYCVCLKCVWCILAYAHM